jgi:O-acetylserine/cysteine efflux transporter
MTAGDAALAAMTSAIWGLGFVATKLGIDGFSAAQLTALRFIVAALPVLVIAPPRLAWHSLVAIGLTLFAGQFLLLFLAFELGMPPGLASVTQQTHAFFTVVLAAGLLGERPTRAQTIGLAAAFAGLALIGATAGDDLPVIALALALGGAFSWAIGNLLVKRTAGPTSMVALIAWASLVPPLPALLLDALDDTHPGLLDALAHASWWSLGGALYLGVVATTVGYGTWAYLLRRYPAPVIAPFALMSPCVGTIGSALAFGEAFPPLRYAGMALILAGLAITLIPRTRERPAGDPAGRPSRPRD